LDLSQIGQLLSGPLLIPRAVLAIILVFFAPGFAWTLVLFRKLELPERLALSVGLSIALVTLSILGLNAIFKVPVSGLNALVTILLITFIPLVWYGLLRFLRRKGARNV